MDVFFVLSGFLITRILLLEQQKSGRIRFFRFYARRALRLLPGLVFMLVVLIPFAGRVVPSTEGDYFEAALASTLYVANFVAVLEPRSLGFLGHTWSLAIEEQFYLLWPPALLLLLRNGWLKGATVLTFCASAAWLLIGYTPSVDLPPDVYYLPWAHGGLLLLGGLTAMTDRRWPSATWVGAAALGSLLAAGPEESSRAGGIAIVLAGLSTSVLLLGLLSRDTWISKLLSWRPAVGLGSVSYGVYLWHFPLFQFVSSRPLGLPLVVGLPLRVATTVIVAVLSYWVVEKPFLRIKDRLPS